MLTRTEGKQLRFHMITIEDLVPEDHFLRKLERHIDFFFYLSRHRRLLQRKDRPTKH